MWQKTVKKYTNQTYLKKLIFDPSTITVTCWLLFFIELILNVVIIERVKYTEIDWIAYMQEVEGFLNGTWDYSQLKGKNLFRQHYFWTLFLLGDTGPLVYPAGFVYIYTALYYITNNGTNIYVAQYIFLVFYMLQLFFSFQIYVKTKKIPPYALILTTLTSYRIHSIFVLRLFNDPIAVLLFYASLHCFLANRWTLGSLFFSLAVSVKMNILLYAPCLLIAYLTNLTIKQTIFNLAICGFIQLILAAPFLYANPLAYIKGSFDFGRVFEHKWTVNYRFLDRTFFENPHFHITLLIVHLSLLILFYPSIKKYFVSYAKLNVITDDLKKQKSAKKLTKHFPKIAQLFVLPFFVTNLIGISCARSLHYQFYSWYFHSLLYLAFSTGYRKPVMFLLLAVIEFCWNTYPSTILSSTLLHLCHVLLLYGVYKTMSQ